MGKTRDVFKKVRDTKGTFHAKMGSIKDRNGMDLTEVEDIKNRWQEYTEELYKQDLHDPDNHDGMTFSSPVATAEFSKFAGILSAALSQHHLLGFEIDHLEFHHVH